MTAAVFPRLVVPFVVLSLVLHVVLYFPLLLLLAVIFFGLVLVPGGVFLVAIAWVVAGLPPWLVALFVKSQWPPGRLSPGAVLFTSAAAVTAVAVIESWSQLTPDFLLVQPTMFLTEKYDNGTPFDLGDGTEILIATTAGACLGLLWHPRPPRFTYRHRRPHPADPRAKTGVYRG